MAGDTFIKKIEEAIQILKKQDPKGFEQYCLNWILITEWADFKNNRFILTDTNEEMTPWNSVGMLYHSIEQSYQEDIEEEVEEE